MPKLDDISIANYTVVANKIVKQYIPYYQELKSNYSDTTTGTGKLITTQLQSLKKILPLLARAIGKHPLPLSKKELKKLDETLIQIVEIHKQVKTLAGQDEILQNASKKSAEDLNISVDEMASVKKNNMASSSTIGGGLDLASSITRALGLPSAGKTAGLGAFLPFLSPIIGSFIGPALLGYEMTRGIGGLVKGLGYTFPKKLFGRKSSTSGLHFGKNTSTDFETNFISQGNGITARKPGAFRTLNRRQKEESTEALFYFFNKRAYKAGWTKDVLNILEGSKKWGATIKDKGKSPTIIPIVGSGISSLATQLGSILGGSLLAAGAGVVFVDFINKLKKYYKKPAKTFGGRLEQAGSAVLETFAKPIEEMFSGPEEKYEPKTPPSKGSVWDFIQKTGKKPLTRAEVLKLKKEKDLKQSKNTDNVYKEDVIKNLTIPAIQDKTIPTITKEDVKKTEDMLQELRKMNLNLELIEANSKLEKPSPPQPSRFNFINDNEDTLLSDFEKSLRWKGDK